MPHRDRDTVAREHHRRPPSKLDEEVRALFAHRERQLCTAAEAFQWDKQLDIGAEIGAIQQKELTITMHQHLNFWIKKRKEGKS